MRKTVNQNIMLSDYSNFCNDIQQGQNEERTTQIDRHHQSSTSDDFISICKTKSGRNINLPQRSLIIQCNCVI